MDSDGQGFRLHSAKNNTRRSQILAEKVIPLGHLVGVHQQQSASNVAGFDEILRPAFAHINDGHVLMRPKSRSPPHRNHPHIELLRRGDAHSGETLGPGSRNREIFGVHAVRSRSFESSDTPIHGLPHCQRPRHPAADLIGELLQILFQRRRLQGFGNHLVDRILR